MDKYRSIVNNLNKLYVITEKRKNVDGDSCDSESAH